MTYTITDIYTDGGDYVISFEINGQSCAMVWDADGLMEQLLDGMTEEQALEAFGDE